MLLLAVLENVVIHVKIRNIWFLGFEIGKSGFISLVLIRLIYYDFFVIRVRVQPQKKKNHWYESCKIWIFTLDKLLIYQYCKRTCNCVLRVYTHRCWFVWKPGNCHSHRSVGNSQPWPSSSGFRTYRPDAKSVTTNEEAGENKKFPNYSNRQHFFLFCSLRKAKKLGRGHFFASFYVNSVGQTAARARIIHLCVYTHCLGFPFLIN